VVLLFPFTVTATQIATLETWSYAGGLAPTTPVATTIPAGGFAPNLVVFDSSGSQIGSDNGSHCGITGADPATGNCDDAFLQFTLTGGIYTAALMEWDNVPTDGLLADGFTQQNNAGFTCAEFGQSGNFCDVTTALGSERTGDYALTIALTDVPQSGVPEPGGFVIMGGGLAALWLQSKWLQSKRQFAMKGNR
jgi:hypothetical protein